MKPTITESRIKLLAMRDTCWISALVRNTLKYQTTPTMIAVRLPTHARITGSRRRMRWRSATAMKATSVPAKVAMSVGMKMSEGSLAPRIARCAITLTGINVKPAVFSTRYMSCASVAVSFTGFSSCRLAIAFSPIGVAALSSPRMLAE